MSSESETAYGLEEALCERLQRPLMNDEAMKGALEGIRSLAESLAEDLEYNLREDLSSSLAFEVRSLAEKSIQAMLDGNESEFARYITARDYSRAKAGGVIHGEIFEYGPEVTCRKLVERYPDLLRDNRVTDLEAQVAGLLKQVNYANAEVERLRDRLSQYA